VKGEKAKAAATWAWAYNAGKLKRGRRWQYREGESIANNPYSGCINLKVVNEAAKITYQKLSGLQKA